MIPTQIKLNTIQDNNASDSPRGKPIFRAAMRLAEKEEQELIEKIEKYHDRTLVRPIDNYEQEKTILQHCLDVPSQDRDKKMLKKIKAELTCLRCFQTHNQEDIPKEVLSVMKKDLDMLTAVISKFVHSKVYSKGSIVETVAASRNKVRVLLRGQMAVFEPINYKSFKNCKKFHDAHNTNAIIRETISMITQKNGAYYDAEHQNHLLNRINPEELEAFEWQYLKSKSKNIPTQTAKKLLEIVGLITVTTPHRLSKHLKKEGELVCSEVHQYIIDQPQLYEHTAICLNQCYMMQLEYEVYRQTIAHLNSDQQKKCIEMLLRKFQHMDYFDAKEYVRNEYIINKQKEELRQKLRQKENPAPLTELERCIRDSEAGSVLVVSVEDEEEQYENVYKKVVKQKEDLETFEMKYENEMYLIIEGEVTLSIDIIQETRLSTLQYASKVRQRHPRAILKLYPGDLFGFQQIGKIKEYQLRYIVTKESTLLLMNEEIYVRHYYQVEGFKSSVKNSQNKRNKHISSILHNLQKTVEKEQLKKYSSVVNIEKHKPTDSPSTAPAKKDITESLLPSHLVPPRQLQFLGRKEFDEEEYKVRQNVIKLQQGGSNGVNLRQILQASDDLNELLAFTSVYKIHLPENCQIVGDFIEVRDSKGKLLRRRAISKRMGGGSLKKSTILTRLGVVNEKERVEHNMQIVKRRKSQFQFQDLDRQKKEFQRLKNWTKSLPKLGNLYAKHEDRVYKHLSKNAFCKYT